MDVEELYGNLIEYEICSEDSLQLATCLAGYSVETLNSVLFILTGYRTWEDYVKWELGEGEE